MKMDIEWDSKKVISNLKKHGINFGKGKTRITIRIDDDVIQWFRQHVHASGGGNYQTRINMALREYITSKRESLEATLRHIIREELSAYGKKSKL